MSSYLEKISKNLIYQIFYSIILTENLAKLKALYRCLRTIPPKRLEQTDAIIFGYFFNI